MRTDVDPVRLEAALHLVATVDSVEALMGELDELRWRILLDFHTLFPLDDETENPLLRRSLLRRPAPVAPAGEPVDDAEPAPEPHPPYDCPDCGREHVEWSVIDAQRAHLELVDREVAKLRRRVDPLLENHDPEDVGRVLNEIVNPYGFSLDLMDQRFRVRVMAAVGNAPLEVRRAYVAGRVA